MQSSLEQTQAEARRRAKAERLWLGAVTQGRPTFAEAEVLDQRGIPSCHAWSVPGGSPPEHLSATQALGRWQNGMCAICSASPSRLLLDHCHTSGLVRGFLCTNCNTAEAFSDAPVFAAYRARSPAVLLGLEEQYGGVWDGFATPNSPERNAALVDAAEALFEGVADRFRVPGTSSRR
ncbi:endonuclease domain-containing protein [Streptomyces sp. NPDC048241]|uniref:endonuclease domain-containing protein n=1 Tax=Streptomyces sp. NPDC048241 TaxID=3365521 RepID=UPI00371197E4